MGASLFGDTNTVVDANIISTISALRAVSSLTRSTAFVQGYYAAGDGGGGNYYLDTTDVTSADNGGTIIVGADGGRWKLDQVYPPTLKQFGAKGDGVTSDAAAFAYFEALGINNNLVQAPPGNYVSGQSLLKKDYQGAGSIKLTSGRTVPGLPSTELQPRYLDPMHHANAVNNGTPRYITVVGDSISYGFGVTEAQSYPSLIQNLLNQRGPEINCDRASGSILDRATIAGSTAVGTAGPRKQSLIMQVGATLSFTVANLDFIGIWFQRAAGAGTITVTANGTNIATFNCAGAVANDSFLQSAFARYATAAIVMTVSVGPVELTGIFNSHTLKTNQPAIINQSASGYATSDFVTAAVTTSLGAQTPATGASFPIYAIALGTNDIYSGTKAVTSVTFKANLRTIAIALRVYGMVVLTVPLRPVETTYTPVFEPFENYRSAVYEVAREFGYYVVDLSQYDLAGTGGYQADGLHPNALGHNLLASIWMKELQLADMLYAMPSGTLALSGAYTANGGIYTSPQYDILAGDLVVLGGLVVTNASAKGTVITTLPADARPAAQRVFVVGGLNGAAGASATIVIAAAGTVTLFDYSSASLTHVSLDGISFVSRR